MSGQRQEVAQKEDEQAQTQKAQEEDKVPEKKEQVIYICIFVKQAGCILFSDVLFA
jgi:hypothetical protein